MEFPPGWKGKRPSRLTPVQSSYKTSQWWYSDVFVPVSWVTCKSVKALLLLIFCCQCDNTCQRYLADFKSRRCHFDVHLLNIIISILRETLSLLDVVFGLVLVFVLGHQNYTSFHRWMLISVEHFTSTGFSKKQGSRDEAIKVRGGRNMILKTELDTSMPSPVQMMPLVCCNETQSASRWKDLTVLISSKAVS